MCHPVLYKCKRCAACRLAFLEEEEEDPPDYFQERGLVIFEGCVLSLRANLKFVRRDLFGRLGFPCSEKREMKIF